MNSSTAVDGLMLQMLVWIDAQPRTYAQAMDAWRSSCPRHPVWDDALCEELINVEARDGTMRDALVTLTPRGRERLNQVAPASQQASQQEGCLKGRGGIRTHE